MPRIAAALAIVAAAALSIGFNIVRYPIVWEKLASRQDSAQSTDTAGAVASDLSDDSTEFADSRDSTDTDTRSAKRKRVTASISGGPSSDDSDSSTSDESTSYRNDRGDRFEEPYSYDSYESGSDTYSDSETSYDDETDSSDTESESGWDRSDDDSQPSAKRGKKQKKTTWNYSSDNNDSEDSYGGYGASEDDDVGNQYADSDETADLDSQSDSWGNHQESKDLVPVGRAAKSGLASRGKGAKSGTARAGGAKSKSGGKVRPLPSVDDWAPNPHAGDDDYRHDSIASYPSTGSER